MKYFLKIGIPLLLLIGFIVYIYSLIEPKTEKQISIATGRESGVYYKYAQVYKKLLEADGISVKIIKTAGSIETLKLLNAKKVDIGFVQGGTATALDKEHLKSIASLYFEPLWLFSNASSEIKYLNELQDKRISMGEVGSGTMALSEKMFSQTNINHSNVTFLNLNAKESYQALKENKIDAFFTVLSPTSTLIHEIMNDKTIQLVHLKRLNAFAKYFLFLKNYKIYEGGIDLKQNIPNRDINLLATVATLITHDEVDNSLVRLVTMKIKELDDRKSIFPSRDYLEIPIHEASEKYLLQGDTMLEKIFPYWIASNIDRLKFLLIPLLTLLFPLFKGFIPLYRWRTRSKIYKWYKTLDTVSENWELFDREQLKEAQKELEALSTEIRSKTNVPLSFKWEYHTLQQHIDNVIERMNRKVF